jgi:hypothetical protein
MTSRRARAQPWSLATLLSCALGSGCELRESAFERGDPVTLTRGRAVSQWDAALRLPTDAAVLPDAAQLDAAAEGGAAALDEDAATPADAGTAVDAAQPAVDAGPSAPLVFHVTTVSQNGSFAPKNVGAIWIQDSKSQFVKALAVWAGVSTRYLTRYCAANKSGNKVDAITSATLRQHQTHEVTWNLTDLDRHEVADGDYQVMVETTDHNGPGQLLMVPFTKGKSAQTISPADQAYFQAIQLRFAGE